ncbi:MAG: hypothetical protein HPY61_04685 [Methanotrichaceae archaeon]|nr:hypothetical protein [Methanotrichaceae archaeon]
MKVLSSLVVMLLLALSATAAPEEVVAGPYTISFDLNTAQEYSLSLHPESADNESTGYAFDIVFDNDTRALIGITEHNLWQYADFPCGFWQNLYLKSDPEIVASNISYPLIDGHPAQVISTTGPRISDHKIVNSTMVEMWLDETQPEGSNVLIGRTKVEMILLLPENMTEALLSSFHVEMKPQETVLTIQSAPAVPSITVRTQTVNDPDGTVVIPEVMSIGPGYVVVFDDYNNIIGYEEVADGTNMNVQVLISQPARSEWLHATLNSAGAVMTKYWQYPFMPEAEAQSRTFLDQRAQTRPSSLGTTAAEWLSGEESTSRMSPYYDRERCRSQLMASGYSLSQSTFYCD